MIQEAASGPRFEILNHTSPSPFQPLVSEANKTWKNNNNRLLSVCFVMGI